MVSYWSRRTAADRKQCSESVLLGPRPPYLWTSAITESRKKWNYCIICDLYPCLPAGITPFFVYLDCLSMFKNNSIISDCVVNSIQRRALTHTVEWLTDFWVEPVARVTFCFCQLIPQRGAEIPLDILWKAFFKKELWLSRSSWPVISTTKP